MKVIILSQIDYTGSAFRLFEAVKRHTDIDINLFSGPPENKLNHPVNNLVNNSNRNRVQEIVNQADILHFKGDWPPVDGYLGLKIPDKPIVITTSGTFFRKKIHGGFERFTTKDYYRATLKTSFETDLLYPEYSDIWTPHPVDSDDKPNIWQPSKRPLFLHIPSSPERKGTEFVHQVFSILKRKIACDAEIITGVDFKTSLELKKKATIYFDQFMVGFYGNAALEAMQWGIPVCAWISETAIQQAKGKLLNCPIINRSMKSPERTADKIIQVYNDPELSVRTKKWCDKIHGYRAIAKIWNDLYRQLC
jgi:hypothetical protein